MLPAQDIPRLQPPSRLPLVGRQAELAQLRTLLEGAARGEPGVGVILGEIGIGKSRLAHALVAVAESMGMAVCQGHFSEDSPVSFEAFCGSFIDRCERAGILESGPAEHSAVLRAMAGAADRTPSAIAGPARHEAPLAMWWAVSELSRRRPFLFVIDDLHWAGAESLGVLLHLVEAIADRASTGEPLAIALVLVSRQAEPGTALARTLARTQRSPSVTWLPLRGLDEIETNEFVVATAAVPCAPPLLNYLMRTGGGNPLFLAETLAELNARGDLNAGRGRLAGRNLRTDVALPPEVQSMINARAAALDAPARSLLSAAAVIGDDFSASLLAEVSETAPAEVATRLAAAEDAGFVADRGEEWRFAHPAFRRSFAGQLSAGRRNRLHLAIARRMQAAGEASSARIAHHLVESGILAPDAEVGRAAMLAGDGALGATAYGEAARMLEVAAGREGFVATLSPHERGRLFYRCGFAHYRDMSVEAARDWFKKAIDASRDAADLECWGDALIGELRVRNAHGRLAIGEVTDKAGYDAFMAAAGEAVPAKRAAAKAMWAELLHNARSAEAGVVASEALELGLSVGDHLTALHACFDLARFHLAQLEPAEALVRNEEAYRYSQLLDDPWYHIWGIQNLAQSHLALGRLRAAEAAARETVAVSREAHDWAIESLGRATLAAIAVLRGDFDDAERLGSEALALYRRSDYSYTPAVLLPPLAYGRALRGEWDAAEDALALLESVAGTDASWTLRQVFRAWQGDLAAVQTEMGARPRRATWRLPPDMFALAAASPRLDLAVALGMPELAEYPLELFEAATSGGVAVTFGPGYLAERGMGLACLTLGRAEEGERWLRAAIARGDRVGARPEAARARLELSALLLEADGSRDEAAALLTAAIREFDLLRMAHFSTRGRAAAMASGIEVSAAATGPYPAGLTDFEFEVLVELARGRDSAAISDALMLSARTVERVLVKLARMAITDAETASAFLSTHGRLFPGMPAASSGPHTASVAAGTLEAWMFTDIVDSTLLNLALGDSAWEANLAEHEARMTGAVHRHGGRVVKSLGDGMFARFSTASAAVACGLEIQSQLPLAIENFPGRELAIRVGIHVGDAIERGGDVIGIAVTTAKRICDAGTTGDVIVSESVCQLAAGGRFGFEDRGRFGLKGLGDMLRLYSASALR